MCRGSDRFQGNAGSTRPGQGDLQGVHVSDSTRDKSELKITLGFLNDSTECKRGTWALRGGNKEALLLC